MAIAQLHRALDRAEAKLRQSKGTAFMVYKNDPIGYARRVLKIEHLTPDQCAVADYVAKNPRCRLLVPSANETGKSFTAAWLMSWHFDVYNPSLTISTAPSQAQVVDIIFRELRKMRRGDPMFSPKAPRLADGDDRLCYGYTAKDANAFHGRHDAAVMGIFDEGEGIEKEFYEAGESFIDRWIVFYNPVSANSYTAVAERSKDWHIIRMSALNHPNVKLGEQGKPPIIPNAVTLDKVIGRLKRYGARKLRESDPPMDTDIVLCGERWRPSPVVEARILGRRPLKPVDSVFTRSDLDNMHTNAVELPKHWALQIGCDVARYGDDFSTIHIRQGRCSIHHESHNGWNTKEVAARLRHICAEFAPRGMVDAKEIPVVIDDTGVGGGVVDQGNGHKFIGVNASSKAEKPDEYPNVRSEMAFDVEDMIRHGLVDLSRIDEDANHDIVEQLSAMSYELGPRGTRNVLAKKYIKALIGKSPDDADGFLLAYYPFPETIEIHR